MAINNNLGTAAGGKGHDAVSGACVLENAGGAEEGVVGLAHELDLFGGMTLAETLGLRLNGSFGKIAEDGETAGEVGDGGTVAGPVGRTEGGALGRLALKTVETVDVAAGETERLVVGLVVAGAAAGTLEHRVLHN